MHKIFALKKMLFGEMTNRAENEVVPRIINVPQRSGSIREEFCMKRTSRDLESLYAEPVPTPPIPKVKFTGFEAQGPRKLIPMSVDCSSASSNNPTSTIPPTSNSFQAQQGLCALDRPNIIVRAYFILHHAPFRLAFSCSMN